MAVASRVRQMDAQTVDLNDIEESPGPFCMSFGFDLHPLVSSIEAVGVIHLPLLRRHQGRIAVVSGYRRIQALRSLNATTALCRILDEEIAPLACLLLNLYDNLATRNLNDVEKGMVLSRLSIWMPRQEIIDRYLPLLGLRPDEKNLRFFLEMESGAGSATKQFVAKEGLTWRVVSSLSDLDDLSRSSLMNGMAKLMLNVNQQTQFIDLSIDISHIKGVPIPQVVSELGIDQIPLDTTANRPQRAKAVIDHLRSERYPTIVGAERRFRKMISDLHLPGGVEITPPPSFEGDRYRMQISFKEGKELTSKLNQLAHMEGLNHLVNPWGGISE